MNSIINQKQKALDYFLDQLMQSDAADQVEEFVLFGSLARGEADQYSDVDLVIFAREPQKVLQEVSVISYKTLMEYGEVVEGQVYPVGEYQNPSSYFVYSAIEKGKRLLPAQR